MAPDPRSTLRGLMLGLVIAGLALAAAPATAASKPPTAMQLVKKLVKAGVCDTPAAQDAAGTVAQCTARFYVITNDLEIHAFKTKAAMLKDLDEELADTCESFGSGGSVPFKPQFRVGPTWWTHPYREVEAQHVAAAIGGQVKTYACP